ncbi:MAG: DegT/DnrJ/EryC1/StrS family aminotransferase [Woeseiaceae bacterium]|nr:DegT/DnrJ/EryC1/StrS family aminotransferase [Woeseiaceae bacterium]
MASNIKMSVPLLDLKAQYSSIREPVRKAIDEVCDSQWFVMGPNVIELEKQVAQYSQCAHGIGVSSGTDALLVALMALDIGRGDAVITTPYTFFATGGVISRLGARPIFCDISPDTYNLDPGLVEVAIERDCDLKAGKLIHRPSGDVVKAIMPVHLYGQTVDMKPFETLAKRFAISLVEDAAQAIGSEYADGRRAGSAADIGCFSFFPSKNLGAFGDGGMCVTNDDELAERLRVLRLHGGKPKYYHAMVGGNFRLDALQAAVLLVKLERLDSWTNGRQSNAAAYNEAFARAGLKGKVVTPVERDGVRHIYNQYVIRVERRDELRAHLGDSDIGTEIYYPVPLHLQKCFADLGYKEGDCPESEKAARETLAVPIYPELSREQIDYVVDTIAGFYG